ncbi:MAG: DUF1178 family protein [Geminicoccaceae bacterium]
MIEWQGETTPAMILFDLLCSKGHGFEAWFRDSSSFDRLVAVGEIQCAVCGDTEIKKALMAPNVRTSKALGRGPDAQTAEEPAPESQAEAAMPAKNAVAPVAVQENADTAPLSQSANLPVPEKVAKALHVLREVQTHIEKNFDHVGKGFAEEARKMHYGEAEKRSIYGEASEDEAKELVEEGIEIDQMPWLPSRNS